MTYGVTLYDQLPNTNLWIGGTLDEHAPEGVVNNEPTAVAAVVTAYSNAEPWLDWSSDVLEIRYSFKDAAPDASTKRRVRRIAAWVAPMIGSDSSKFVVIIRCQAGLNRSAWIAAHALTIRGCTPQQAVEAIRQARGPEALFNKHFLHDLGYQPSAPRIAPPQEPLVQALYVGSLREHHGLVLVGAHADPTMRNIYDLQRVHLAQVRAKSLKVPS